MTDVQAFVLGLIQGITEFLPISSSGHLKLAEHLLGLQDLDKLILFDLVCHLGTLLAILLLFRREIGQLFTKEMLLATLPLFPLALFLKPIEKLFAAPGMLGFFFLATACILYIGIAAGRRGGVLLLKSSSKRALLIGTSQALAIFPGVSRSGTTLSAGRLLGMSQEESFRFSFLIAIPAILGGTALMLLKLLLEEGPLPPVTHLQYLIAFVTSFLVGCGALKLLFRLATRDKLTVFVWYCLVLGTLTILLHL